jgi:hypothetical protein
MALFRVRQLPIAPTALLEPFLEWKLPTAQCALKELLLQSTELHVLLVRKGPFVTKGFPQFAPREAFLETLQSTAQCALKELLLLQMERLVFLAQWGPFAAKGFPLFALQVSFQREIQQIALFVIQRQNFRLLELEHVLHVLPILLVLRAELSLIALWTCHVLKEVFLHAHIHRKVLFVEME